MGHYLIKIWNPKENFSDNIFKKSSGQNSPMGPKGEPLPWDSQHASTLTNELAPLGRGVHPMGHRPSTLTNEPAPLGRGSLFKGHRLSLQQLNSINIRKQKTVHEQIKRGCGKVRDVNGQASAHCPSQSADLLNLSQQNYDAQQLSLDGYQRK